MDVNFAMKGRFEMESTKLVRTRFQIYCDILRIGLLNIRNSSNDPEHCFAEADHLHNLPELLLNLDHEGLHRYYWEAMRPSFIGQSKPEWIVMYHELWRELEEATHRECLPQIQYNRAPLVNDRLKEERRFLEDKDN